LREAWGSRYPGVVALWAGDSGAFLRFYGYPKVLWPYLRSTNLMERFIREIRRGTKVRDHKFLSEEAVYKLLYLGSERQEGRWAERRLKGFGDVKEVLEKMLQERYAPRTQTLTHSILSAKYWLTVSFSVNTWSSYAHIVCTLCTYRMHISYAHIGCYMSGNYWRIVTL
jgi:hypothetical protein